MSEEVVTKSVTGRCEEVSEKNGWTAFSVDVGTQYPVRLSTKLDPLIELGRAAVKDGGVFTWTFKESQGGENPHKPGTFYTNRYLSGVEKAAEGAESDSPATGAVGAAPTTPARQNAADGMTPEKWDAKERRDYRSRAWAQTISALTHTIKVDESAGDVFRRLHALQRMIYRDIVRDFDPDAFPDDDVPFS